MIERLALEKNLNNEDLLSLILQEKTPEGLFAKADYIRQKQYGKDVFIRGLIEFTNYCKNNCFYCGIRRDNHKASRYRLSNEDILQCCDEGYLLGFRTFVLQGGEDGYYSDYQIAQIVESIKKKYPDCAVTLSIGEKSRSSYQTFFNAGADRYLLRHETANEAHYQKLHPSSMSLSRRKECLFQLKEIGYQVGAGFMVGSPYQTPEMLVEDLRFLQKLEPEMIGIGPYIKHSQTPFCNWKSGELETTLRLIAILRLMFPYALIPATTALGTIHPRGREMGLKAGANVVMPNLSPVAVRKSYELYDHKICTGEESAQCRGCLEKRINSAGYQIVVDRGDCLRHDMIGCH